MYENDYFLTPLQHGVFLIFWIFFSFIGKQ